MYKYFSCGPNIYKSDSNGQLYYSLGKDGSWHSHNGFFNGLYTQGGMLHKCMEIHNKFDFFASKFISDHLLSIFTASIAVFIVSVILFKYINKRNEEIKDARKKEVLPDKVSDYTGRDNIMYGAKLLRLYGNDGEDASSFWPNSCKTVREWHEYICNRLDETPVEKRDFFWRLKEFNIFALVYLHYYGRKSNAKNLFFYRKAFFLNYVTNMIKTSDEYQRISKTHNEDESLDAWKKVFSSEYFSDHGYSYTTCSCETREDLYRNHILSVITNVEFDKETGTYTRYKWFLGNSIKGMKIGIHDTIIKRPLTIEEAKNIVSDPKTDEKLAALIRHGIFYLQELSPRDREYLTFISTPGSRGEPGAFIGKPSEKKTETSFIPGQPISVAEIGKLFNVSSKYYGKEMKKAFDKDSLKEILEAASQNKNAENNSGTGDTASMTFRKWPEVDIKDGEPRYIEKYYGWEDAKFPPTKEIINTFLKNGCTMVPTKSSVPEFDIEYRKIDNICFADVCTDSIFNKLK